MSLQSSYIPIISKPLKMLENMLVMWVLHHLETLLVQLIKENTHTCPIGAKILKSDLSMAARSARIHDPEIKEYFERKTAQRKDFGVVLNAIKYKLIQRMFAVVKRGTPFVQL